MLRAEFTYAYRLNVATGEDYFAGRITLLDRYAFDRCIKMGIVGKPRLQRWLARLNCRLMRPPRLSFVMADDPESIRRRKQQLTTAEIADFQNDVEALCRDSGAEWRVMTVNGRAPEALAAEAAAEVLRAAGADLFYLIRLWDHTERQGIA